MRKTSWIGLALLLFAAGGIVAFHGIRHVPADRVPSGKPRIVSLRPSVTEIVFALGRGDWLVGATDRCDYPPEAMKIARVGGYGAPNVEKLLALRPDLVIADGLERNEVAELLRRSGIRVLDVRIRNFEELFDAIRQIGKAVDRRQQAGGLVARMQAELEAVAAKTALHPPESVPRSLWR